MSTGGREDCGIWEVRTPPQETLFGLRSDREKEPRPEVLGKSIPRGRKQLVQMPRGGKRLGLFEGGGFGLKSEVGGGALDTKLQRNFTFVLRAAGRPWKVFSKREM